MFGEIVVLVFALVLAYWYLSLRSPAEKDVKPPTYTPPPPRPGAPTSVSTAVPSVTNREPTHPLPTAPHTQLSSNKIEEERPPVPIVAPNSREMKVNLPETSNTNSSTLVPRPPAFVLASPSEHGKAFEVVMSEEEYSVKNGVIQGRLPIDELNAPLKPQHRHREGGLQHQPPSTEVVQEVPAEEEAEEEGGAGGGGGGGGGGRGSNSGALGNKTEVGLVGSTEGGDKPVSVVDHHPQPQQPSNTTTIKEGSQSQSQSQNQSQSQSDVKPSSVTVQRQEEKEEAPSSAMEWLREVELKSHRLQRTVRPGATDNERCLVGVDLFFNNQLEQAEAYFKKEVETSAIFSLSYSAVGFLKAVMTWDKDTIKEAIDRVEHTSAFAARLAPSEGTASQLGRMFTRKKAAQLSTSELEGTLIGAECMMLQSMIYLTQESMASYLKAGLGIRSGYKSYDKCEKELAALAPGTKVDESVTGGIQFGLGCFNVVTSLLPQIVLRIVAVMGYPSDMDKGEELLTKCIQGAGVRAPLAMLELLAVHVVIPGFFTVRLSHHIQLAERVLGEAFKLYSRSALFLWIYGRMLRMKRDVVGATEVFTQAADANKKWLQLQHLCAYELGWCHFFQLRFEPSLPYWQQLQAENSWSKGVFAFLHGIVLVEQGNHQGAAKVFQEALGLCNRKFGGKVISEEQFVLRKGEGYLNNPAYLILPGLELCYVFHGFTQMSRPSLAAVVSQVDARLKSVNEKNEKLLPGQLHLLRLLKGAAMKYLNNDDPECLPLLEQCALATTKDVGPELYVIPYARFEILHYYLQKYVNADASGIEDKEAWKNAKWWLGHISHFKEDYNFKIKLHLRVHLARKEMAELRKARQSKSKGKVDNEEDLEEMEEAAGENLGDLPS